MSKIYYQGETMRQRVRVTNLMGALVDPDTIVITIVDPDGTLQVNEQDMAKYSIGVYQYDYLLDAAALTGKWKTEVKAVKGYTQIEQDEFTVLEAI